MISRRGVLELWCDRVCFSVCLPLVALRLFLSWWRGTLAGDWYTVRNIFTGRDF